VLRGRWLVGHLLVLLFAGGFIALGVWQLHRNQEKHDKVEAARAAYAAPAPDITRLGDTPAGDRAQAVGTYDPAHEVLLRDQVRRDKTGFDVLTPLRLSDGTSALVDRGWVASNFSARAPNYAAPPTGTVTVRGLLRESRPPAAEDDTRSIDNRLSFARVDTKRIAARLGITGVRPVWIEAQYQSPAPAADAPQLPEPPAPDPVNHMEYAIEWFGLALIPIVGWPIVLARRRRAELRTSSTMDSAQMIR
jgi:cytochrome oxidase assembly protein ShyY1